MRRIRKKNAKKLTVLQAVFFAFVIIALSVNSGAFTVCAAGGADIVRNGFDTIYDIIAAVVSSIGTLLLLWGIFEWAQSMNTQDGGAQSMAFKRIGAGIVACLGPQLIPLITQGMNLT